MSNLKFSLFTSIVCLALTGCTSKQSINLIEEYAKQSTQVQGLLLEVYESTDSAKIDAELVKAVRDGITVNNLKIPTIEYSGQKSLLKSLDNFSQSIYFLATDNHGDELDKYSEKLHTSLSSLSELSSKTSMDKEEIELLSTSVNAIARAYTEHARYKLLKKVMINSEPIIQHSLTSLTSELISWKEATKVSLEKELRIRLYLLNNPNRCAQINNKRCAIFYHSLEEYVEAYKKAYEIKSHIDGLDVKFSKLNTALNSIKDLNIAIVQSLKQDNDLSIKAAKKAIKLTKIQIDSIKNFRNEIGQ